MSYALFADKDRSLDLVTLLVEPVSELPLWCEGPLPIDCTLPGVDTDELLFKACIDLVSRLKGTRPTSNDLLAQRVRGPTKDSLEIERAMENYRKSCFVLKSNVLKTPVELSRSSRCKDSLKDDQTGGLRMSADGSTIAPSSNETAQEASPELTQSETSSAVSDLALSFASSDNKSASFLKQLLLEKKPSLTISEPRAGDFTRVKGLENARVVVPLLSPAFLASKELVEELNIAIFRERYSLRQILFPIQIAAIPPLPTYVHLIPCEFSSVDYEWAWKIIDENLQDEISKLSQTHDLSEGELFSLKSVCDSILGALFHDVTLEFNPAVNRVLLNIRETEEDWKRIQRALYEQQGLEAWKKAFGLEINKQEGGFIEKAEERFTFSVEGREPNKEKMVQFDEDGRSEDKAMDLNEVATDERLGIAKDDSDDNSTHVKSNPYSSESKPNTSGDSQSNAQTSMESSVCSLI